MIFGLRRAELDELGILFEELDVDARGRGLEHFTAAVRDRELAATRIGNQGLPRSPLPFSLSNGPASAARRSRGHCMRLFDHLAVKEFRREIGVVAPTNRAEDFRDAELLEFPQIFERRKNRPPKGVLQVDDAGLPVSEADADLVSCPNGS